MSDNHELQLYEDVFRDGEDFRKSIADARTIENFVDVTALNALWQLVTHPKDSETQITELLSRSRASRELVVTMVKIEHLMSLSLKGDPAKMSLAEATATFLRVCKTIEAALKLHDARKHMA